MDEGIYLSAEPKSSGTALAVAAQRPGDPWRGPAGVCAGAGTDKIFPAAGLDAGVRFFDHAVRRQQRAELYPAGGAVFHHHAANLCVEAARIGFSEQLCYNR